MTHRTIHLVSNRMRRERRAAAMRRVMLVAAAVYLTTLGAVSAHRSYATGYLGEGLHRAGLIGRECGLAKATMYAAEEDQFPTCTSIERL